VLVALESESIADRLQAALRVARLVDDPALVAASPHLLGLGLA
jgi:hypothetical protein